MRLMAIPVPRTRCNFNSRVENSRVSTKQQLASQILCLNLTRLTPCSNRKTAGETASLHYYCNGWHLALLLLPLLFCS